MLAVGLSVPKQFIYVLLDHFQYFGVVIYIWIINYLSCIVFVLYSVSLPRVIDMVIVLLTQNVLLRLQGKVGCYKVLSEHGLGT